MVNVFRKQTFHHNYERKSRRYKLNSYAKHFVNFQPCGHNCNGHGTCQRTGKYFNDFSCKCDRGYNGKICDRTRMACDLAKSEGNVCQKGGYCQDVRDPFDYWCVCFGGWTRKYCEIPDVSSVPLLSQLMKWFSLLMCRQIHSLIRKYN